MKVALKRVRKTVAETPIYAMIIVYFILASIFVPYFFTGGNILNLFLQASDLVIGACGLMLIILNAGIDFSFVGIMGLGSTLAAMIMNTKTGVMAESSFGWVVGLIVFIAVGLVIGVINGFAVTKLKMPSFMATMASYLIFKGVALTVVNSKPISSLPTQFNFIGNGKLFGIIPFPIVLAAVVVVCMFILLNKTIFGRQLYAIGTSHQVAKCSGVPVKKVIFKVFVISGLLSAISGIVSMSRLGAAKPALNDERMMDFVAAVVLGGTSMFGGKGNIFGTVVGALFIIMINNSLGILGLQWYEIIIVKGVFFVAIAIFDAVSRTRAAR